MPDTGVRPLDRSHLAYAKSRVFGLQAIDLRFEPDSKPLRNVLYDHFSMKASVFDEDFVGVHSGDHDTRQIDSGNIAFKRTTCERVADRQD